MSRKPKPLRQCTDWPAINEQLEIAGAVLDRISGDHRIYKVPHTGGTIVTKSGGFVCHGTRASVIRMARLAGLPILLSALIFLAVAFQYHLL
jgi:predicted RNA binding protein YcfA (HicA-like mRNA interferase family)